MNYKTVLYFAKKWKIDERRVRVLCEEKRIPGVVKVGKTWMIPEDSSKPIDRRFKNCSNCFYSNIDFKLVDDQKQLIDKARPLSKSIVQQLQDKLIVDWTYNSNAIEGNTLTMSETKVVLENGITIKGKPLKDHLETINHKEAIDFVEELVREDKPLTEFNIKSIHSLILNKIDSKNAGIYRIENVFISGAKHIPPNYLEVPQEMQKLIVSYNKWNSLHPVIRACFLHGEFVKIHPFIDGNGRTARLLLNFELIKNGYPPIIIKNECRAEYYEALDKAHTTNDYSLFINIVMDLLNESLDQYLYLLKK